MLVKTNRLIIHFYRHLKEFVSYNMKVNNYRLRWVKIFLRGFQFHKDYECIFMSSPCS